MKKISTAAAREIGKVEGQRLTIGLDWGDRSSWYCVLDGAGEVILEQKVGTTPKAMKEGRVRNFPAACESNWKPRKSWGADERHAYLYFGIDCRRGCDSEPVHSSGSP